MLYLRPDRDRDEYGHGRAPAGRSAASGPTIGIGNDEEGAPTVVLSLEPRPAETFDDRDIDRELTADEARELAAALWHFAEMADRAAGLR